MDEINWFSMVLSTLFPILLGIVVYQKTIGSGIGKAQTLQIIGAFCLAILMFFLLSFFLLNFNNSGINQEGDFDTFQHGAWHGLFVAITVVTPVVVISGFYGKKNWKFMLTNVIYWIITLALMGGILDAMNHWENMVLPE